ncbi:cation transporter [Erysipelothrix rhusiopathiae]|uniref:heavy-metal-associated domain-containing protein n=1 Tax=Erysipelothrix rhusiopathiae TaxID=1648 RepID=UPI000F4386E2|nr:cation transporter [Erysipelothrix rhusiopathiae]AYV34215.1 metal-binding protein [Erysipelothrix rhusiopathiae]MDE8032227.1 cation transporter [Erysipelothrix rhusiopathiae]MDE8043284.1 cation transporter [Erysipelothrix rhusiopathiae]MDE8054365.1 cation transporter [Erysipelothrix rhusiopathiae]MDE8056055.1 cation transporter [Erysipelothrix rhusiopathiae]
MKQAILQLEQLACPTCMQKIEGAVKRVDGVNEDKTQVMFNASKLKTEFDETKTNLDEIQKAIESVGYEVISAKER